MRSCFDASREAYQLHLEALGRRPGTINLHRNALRSWATFCSERHVKPLSPSPADAERWLGSLYGLYARNTVRDYFMALRSFFKWAEIDALSNLPVPKVPQVPIRPYRFSELRRMVMVATTARDKAIVLVLLGSGMRASELTGLHVNDISWPDGALLLDGKGGKKRVVCPGENAMQALRTYMKGDSIRSGFVFRSYSRRPREDGELTVLGLWSIIRRLTRRAGIEEAGVHRFRHTFAHEFLSAGGDVGDLKVILGHSTITMSLRYAQYYESERALEAQKRLSPADRLFGRGISAIVTMIVVAEVLVTSPVPGS